MTILLDVSRLVWRSWQRKLPTGIDRTALAYVQHFRTSARAVVQSGKRTIVLNQESSRELFDVLLVDGNASRWQLAKLLGKVALRNVRQALFPGNRRCAGQTYINVGHTGLNRAGHGVWLARSGVSPVYFVHDLIPLTHPEYCRDGEAPRHLRRIMALLTHGQGIICNSRATLNELAAFADQRAIPMPSALVAPLGANSTLAISAVRSAPLDRPYFVMLGTIEGRKNHLIILTLWGEMARKLGANCPQLVILGQRGWESEQAVDLLERSEAIKGHVIELSRCADAAVVDYISGSRALLFPSFVEGYGLPLVEALSYGTPVIASDLPVFRELAGEIPDYVSPIDGLGWLRLIMDYAEPDSTMRHAQLSRMKHWKPTTWADHFTLVDEWLSGLNISGR